MADLKVNIGTKNTETPKGYEVDYGGTNYGGASSSATKVSGQINEFYTYSKQSSSIVVSSVKISDEQYSGKTEDFLDLLSGNISNITSNFTAHVTSYNTTTSTSVKFMFGVGNTYTHDDYSDNVEFSDAYMQEQDDFNRAKELLIGREAMLKEIAQNKADWEYHDNTKNDPPKEKKDNWNFSWSIGWNGAFSDFNKPLYLQEVPQQFLENFIDGSADDWMAGGKYYDSPRAGGALFNVTGDLNTVRFLGLQDRNYNTHLDRQLNNMGDVQRMLNVTAGTPSQDSSSLTKLHQANIAKLRNAVLEHNAMVYDELYKYDKWSHMSREEKSDAIQADSHPSNSVGDVFTDVGRLIDKIGDSFGIDTDYAFEFEFDRWGDDFDTAYDKTLGDGFDAIGDVGTSAYHELEDFGKKVFGW